MITAEWLMRQRWFAAHGRTVRSVAVAQRVPFADSPRGELHLLMVRFDGSPFPECYQVPVGFRPDGTCYDALTDPELAFALLRFTGAPTPLPPSPTVRPVGAEQSNSSVVFADRYILKVFRRIWAGDNPDLVLHHALCKAGSNHIAEPMGSIRVNAPIGHVTLALLQRYVANAAEGWAMAQASLRDLLATTGTNSVTAGGDFTSEARRLGSAVAAVHADLARALGTQPAGRADSIIERMLSRLAIAIDLEPRLAPHADALRSRLTICRIRGLQTVHGDLHLGQVLRAPDRWLLIDFEGEPSLPIPGRLQPDSPLRDVAGMMRSFDYVAGHHALDSAVFSRDDELRSQEWVRRNQQAFLDGYTDAAGLDPRDSDGLLTAYLLEKALYELSYEVRNRPQWSDIPLQAVFRLIGVRHVPQ